MEVPRRDEEDVAKDAAADIVVEEEDPETPSSNDSEIDSDSSISSDSDSDDGNDSDEDLDLSAAIFKEIKEELYTCLVCTSEVGPDSRVWACSGCYRVYHISCINNWSQKGSSTDEHGNWKCPACNATHRKQKFQNRCWCKKVIHPPVNPINPNSCGQTCGAKLEGCPHRCTLPCHPGPHAACNALGPPMKCHCGNHETQWPCVLTPYAEGWQCDDVCQELLPCEVHICGKKCHDGLCGKCQEFVQSKCYCGETSDFVKCHLKKPLISFGVKKEDNWIGNFKCSKVSEVKYDCKVHSDTVSCQPRSRKPKHCPLSPDIIKSCPCGQTSIEELNNGENRSSCSDPIPICSKLCNRKLACGHTCKWTCHEGECSPCYEFVKSKCRCGFSSFTVPCKFLQSNNVPTCARKCSSLLSCRRHRCNNVCCADEAVALTRERIRKKAIRNNTTNARNSNTNDSFSIEASHVCLQVCNKKLPCGNPDHLCQRTCHVGPCPPCLESSNDDLVCHCGQTVLMAPVRCGHTLPPCESQCIREMPCGHQQMPHNCHPDDVACPKCTKGVEKMCNCGKKKVRAMCYQEEVFCGERCGKKLPCQHHCFMTCHKGPCVCKSICGKKKKYCDHVDKKPCHFPSRCDDSETCKDDVVITCKCGRIKKVVRCGANAETKSKIDTVLGCEVSCVLQERETKLKEAFGVTDRSLEEKLELSDLPYSEEILITTSVQTKWCLGIESILRDFIRSEKKTLDFKPMRNPQRQYIHQLAEVYKLHSESQDPEPHRSVYIAKTESSKMPEYSLSLALKVYQRCSKPQEAKSSKLVSEQKPTLVTPDYNALMISDTIIGVTRDDLEDSIGSVLSDFKSIRSPMLRWIEGGKYLLIPEAFMRSSETMENDLKRLLPVLKVKLSMNFLANSVELVKINQDYNIVKVLNDQTTKEPEISKVLNEQTEKQSETSEELAQGVNNLEIGDEPQTPPTPISNEE